MSVKDWISIVISIGALSVSLATAYFNIFRQTDDVRLALSDIPTTGVQPKLGKVSVQAQQSFTFINSGNRPAVIARLQLAVVQPSKTTPSPTSCKPEEDGINYYAPIPYQFVPVVIKPAEVSAVSATLAWRKTSDGLVTVGITPENSSRTDRHYVFMCLLIDLVTPDNVVVEKAVPLGIDYQNIVEGGGGDTKLLFDRLKPIPLLQNRQFVFPWS